MAVFENIFEVAITKVWYFLVAKLKVYIFSQAALQHKVLKRRYRLHEYKVIIWGFLSFF
jgi:hypothetical protein